jgi:hypothetical protein
MLQGAHQADTLKSRTIASSSLQCLLTSTRAPRGSSVSSSSQQILRVTSYLPQRLG